MRLSTKGRYGSRAMLELALRYGNGPVLVRDISKAQDISGKYLERIFFTLKNAGLVKSQRGTKGGYILAKPAAEIKLIQIIKALEGSLAPVECVDEPLVCKRNGVCVTREIWEKIKYAIEEILSSVTLDDLVRQYRRKNKCQMKMYYI